MSLLALLPLFALAQGEPTEPLPPPDATPPPPAVPEPAPTEPAPPPPPEESEGRRIVSAYNSGFQWGLVPGVAFDSGGTAAFFLGLRLGYGFDTGTAILVPGVELSAYFFQPSLYIGMPVLKIVYPVDRFAPFVEGGAGVGYISSDPSQTGVALMGGGGFMLHPSWNFGIGAEATYQAITGTGFRGFGIGPILAIGF